MKAALCTTILGMVCLTATADEDQLDTSLSSHMAAMQSSTSFDGVSGRAVDGNIDGNFLADSCTHTDEFDPAPWWQVELARSTRVSTVNIYNRRDCCSERLNNFRVLLCEHSSCSDARSCGSTVQVSALQELGFLTVRCNAVGRFVRLAKLTAPLPNILTICELHVWGMTRDEMNRTSKPSRPPRSNTDATGVYSWYEWDPVSVERVTVQRIAPPFADGTSAAADGTSDRMQTQPAGQLSSEDSEDAQSTSLPWWLWLTVLLSLVGAVLLSTAVWLLYIVPRALRVTAAAPPDTPPADEAPLGCLAIARGVPVFRADGFRAVAARTCAGLGSDGTDGTTGAAGRDGRAATGSRDGRGGSREGRGGSREGRQERFTPIVSTGVPIRDSAFARSLLATACLTSEPLRPASRATSRGSNQTDQASDFAPNRHVDGDSDDDFELTEQRRTIGAHEPARFGRDADLGMPSANATHHPPTPSSVPAAAAPPRRASVQPIGSIRAANEAIGRPPITAWGVT